jgi:hypothetical protein
MSINMLRLQQRVELGPDFETLAAQRTIVRLEGKDARFAVCHKDGYVQELDPKNLNFAAATLLDNRVVTVADENGRPVPLATVATPLMAALHSHARLFPVVNRVVRGPCYDLVGDRLVRAPVGLDVVKKRIVTAPRFNLLPTPDPAYPLLKTLFSGLLFQDPLYLGNLVGTFVAAWARTALRDFPIILLDGNQKSCGKSTVARAFMYLFDDKEPDSLTYKGTQERMETDIGTKYAGLGVPGPNPIWIDNIMASKRSDGMVQSQLLSSAANSHIVTANRHYFGPSPVSEPIFLLTMNKARISPDLSDKSQKFCLRIPPTMRQRVLNPPPDEFARDNVCGLVAEIESLLEPMRFIPFADTFFTRMYLYEQIVTQVATALGLSFSMDPEKQKVMDPLAEELINLMGDEFTGAATAVDDTCMRLQAQGVKLPAWHAEFEAQHRSQTGLKAHFRMAIRRLVNKDYNMAGGTYRLNLIDDKLSITAKETI